MGNGCQSSADVPVPKVVDPKVPAGWFDAARKGDLAAGEALLKSSPKFDVNAPSPPDGLTALGLSCEAGHAAYVTFLVRTAGADARRCSHRVGDRPLHAACLNGDVAVARALLDCGARVNEPLAGTLLTPLHHAAIAGRSDVVALLLERKADGSLKCSRGQTAADAAQAHGKHSVVAQIEAVAGEGVLASTEVKVRAVECAWCVCVFMPSVWLVDCAEARRR
jgi:ankyrin repeat protein